MTAFKMIPCLSLDTDGVQFYRNTLYSPMLMVTLGQMLGTLQLQVKQRWWDVSGGLRLDSRRAIS